MGTQILPANLLQCGLLSLHGSTGPARTCSRVGSPRSNSLLQASTCSSVGYSMGCRWVSAPLWILMGCRGTACLTTVISTGCRGTSDLAPGAPPPPPSSLTLMPAELFLSDILTPFSRRSCRGGRSGLAILKYVIAEALPPSTDGLGLGLWWVSPGVGWHWLYQTQGKLLAACHRSHLCSPSTTKNLPTNPIHHLFIAVPPLSE